MQQVFRVEGMRCDGCVEQVRRALAPLAEQVHVTLEPPQAVLRGAAPVPLQAVQQALQAAGKYRGTVVDAD